jgi:predicted Zn-dependent protease
LNADSSGFVAQASNPGLGYEVAHGRIVLDRWRLKFESPALTLEIPLTQLEIARGQGEDEGVYLTDPNQPGWEICTFETAILRDNALLTHTHTRSQLKEMQSRGEANRTLKITLYCLVGVVVAAIVATMLVSLMVRVLVARIPVEWEQKMGDSLMAEVKQEATFVEDPKLKAKLLSDVAPLVTALPKTGVEYKFYIVDDPTPNAFALPGGHVLVNTGLLELSKRPEELLGVVAHEVAHVTEKHSFRQMIAAAGPFLIFRTFLGGGSTSLLGAGSQMLVTQSFSQEYELEADAVGFQYLVAAHIDPRGLADMLGKLEAEEHRFADHMELRAFSSHPATEKRILRLNAKWKKLRNKSGFIDFNQLDPTP